MTTTMEPRIASDALRIHNQSMHVTDTPTKESHFDHPPMHITNASLGGARFNDDSPPESQSRLACGAIHIITHTLTEGPRLQGGPLHIMQNLDPTRAGAPRGPGAPDAVAIARSGTSMDRCPCGDTRRTGIIGDDRSERPAVLALLRERAPPFMAVARH